MCECASASLVCESQNVRVVRFVQHRNVRVLCASASLVCESIMFGQCASGPSGPVIMCE